MTEFYSNGTASVTNGDATVNSVGAAVWIAANVKKGDLFLAGNTVNVLVTDPVYDSGTSKYTFELGLNYAGTTNTSVPYIIVKTSAEWGTNRTLSLQTAELIQGYAVGAITETQLNAAVAAAQAAQTAAELALDQFTDIWLGVKAADPTSDNDGNALADGSFYLNSVTGLVRIRAAGAWTNFNAGVQGIQGVGAGLQYTAMTSTTDADPGGPGNLRFNNTDHTAATKLWLDDTDTNNVSMAAVIMAWGSSTSSVKGHLFVWNRANRAIYRLYNVTAGPTDKTGYREVMIAHVSSNGTLANTTSVEVIFIPKGDKGDTGATGQADGTPMVFSTTITDADPGNGKVRANNATFASITQLFFDNQDANGVALTAWLDSFDDVVNANARGYLRGRKATDPSVWMEFAVTGAVVDGGGYRKLAVSPISGAIPADLTSMVWTFSPSGKDGAAGSDGADPGVLFNFDTSTTDSNPTAGGLRANNGTLTSATMLYVSKTARGGNSIATFLATLNASSNPTVKGTIVLTKPADKTQVIFNITALTDATGYVKLTVQDGSGAAAFSANDPISFQFTRTGDRGSSGAGTGDFNGPASATSGNIVEFDGGTGKLGRDSGKKVADFALAANNGSDFADKQAVIDTISLKGAAVTSATTVNLDTVTGQLVHVTGTTPVTGFTLTSGRYRRLIADAALPLVAGANHVINNGGSNYTCAPGDQLDVYADGTVIRVAVIPISGSSPAALPAGYLDTDGALTANSDTKVASQKATRTYVGTAIAAYVAAQDVEIFKGGIDCSANPNYPAADAGNVYRVTVAGKIGGASGVNVEVGDRLECTADSTASGNQATVGANWMISQVNIDGAVVGPASSTSGNLASFNGTGGKTVQDSGVAASDVLTKSDNLASLANVGTARSNLGAIGASDTVTLTNKRVTRRVTAIASNAAPTINTDSCDFVDITALAAAITSMTTNLSGTPTNGQTLTIRIKDNGTARAISWGTGFEAAGQPLPTTTIISKRLTVGLIFDTTTSKWGCVAVAQEA